MKKRQEKNQAIIYQKRHRALAWCRGAVAAARAPAKSELCRVISMTQIKQLLDHDAPNARGTTFKI
jgi:hypothetical protein